MTSRGKHDRYRKNMVLGIVVNEYIKTINPVSSSYIKEEYGLEFSSATIRNILADLEHEGYLTHPHTSAGRVPTPEGYRFYVDHLMEEIHLLEEEKRRLRREYEADVRDLEVLMEWTSELVSDLTHYTTIISVDGWKNKLFCKGMDFVVEYPEARDLDQIRHILRALEEKRRIYDLINQDLERKIRIYIGHELACSQICDCSLAVSRYQMPDGPSGRIAVLGPTRMNYPKVVSTLQYISELLETPFS